MLGVVLYRNTRRQLERLLASLEANRRTPGTPAFETLWLDNSPEEGLQGVLAELGVDTGYAHSGANLGFGRAQNRLMAQAFGQPSVTTYVCVNPDAVLHPSCLLELVAEHQRLPRPGLVEAQQFPDEHPKPYDPASHHTDWCSGCVLSISRALYETIGGYDDRIFLYCEDVDLSWRARAAGFDIALAPRALVHHYTGDREPGGNVAREMLRAGAYLAAKWGNDDFGALCAREYRNLTGEALAPVQTPRPTRAMKKVADFNHLFHFSKTRW
jgi:hypothetical protein